MKILCTSLWKNSWIGYWTKYIESRGHEVKWHVGTSYSYNAIKGKVEWSDAVLNMWAAGWSHLLTQVGIGKPIYVIARSFEIFEDTKCGGISQVVWENVRQLFMLNESHYPIFKEKVPTIKPIFIKVKLCIIFLTLCSLIFISSCLLLNIVELALRLFWSNPYAGSGADKILKLRVHHEKINQKFDRRQIDKENPNVSYRTNNRSYIEPAIRFDNPDLTIAFWDVLYFP